MQETVVILLVLGALTYLGYRLHQQLNKKADCGPNCGCESGSFEKLK